MGGGGGGEPADLIRAEEQIPGGAVDVVGTGEITRVVVDVNDRVTAGQSLALIDPEQIEQIRAALDSGASKASVCRSFKVARSTLLDTLERVGWTASAKA